MNKRLKGILFVILGIFFIYFLINKGILESSNSSSLKLLNAIINILKIIFGKMLWFIVIFIITAGLFNIFLGHLRLRYHKSKVIALITLYIAWSVLLIHKYVPLEISNDFMEAGGNLLEIGFNGESGGIIGSILSMPFYKIIHFYYFGIALKIIITLMILILTKEIIAFGFFLLVSILKYYRSEEYKKKKELLRAKKIQERQKYEKEQRDRAEGIKNKVIDSRKQKIDFELSKKPKDHFLQKTEIYSETELIDKEKEWLQIIEQNTNEEKIKDFENDEIEEIERKVIELDSIKEEVKEVEEKVEELEEKVIKKEINVEAEIEVEKIGEFEKKKERKETGKIEEEILIEEEESDDKLINSINEIFETKPIDENKKQEIEKGIKQNIAHLEEVLKEFGVEAKVVNYEYGPTITRYEITIPKGVRVNKVSSLQDDIQLSLAAKSVRIEAPIPGKNTIGIEVPNKVKEPVHFSNLIRNPELDKGALNIILGKNIVGKDKIIDITKMPHLLIAGQTGSGKSVAVNTLISTLISKKSEKEVRFIMVDPKMVELMPYNGIPHLLVPVIIDPQQAAIALKWAVNEMENRYRQLMENGVRNIEGYNSLGYLEKMPYIVIIIDELADLMMVASGSVEESIARIAQKARAVGIHLIVATQRPSTDVITGMIKANLPSRISFSLRSQIDSRTILDTPGAEKLLGQGDMLLLENGSSNTERIQGAWISDEEVIKLTTALKSSKKVQYMEEILVYGDDEKKEQDPLFENAIDVIKQEGRVSISLLQRKLSVGFNRAARIYEQLKENGVIDNDNQILIDDFE